MEKTFHKEYKNSQKHINLKVSFVGIEKNTKIKDKKIEALLDEHLSEHVRQEDYNIISLIKKVRRILLCKYEEKELEMDIHYKSCICKEICFSKVKYEKGKLVFFEDQSPLWENDQLIINTKFNAPLEIESSLHAVNRPAYGFKQITNIYDMNEDILKEEVISPLLSILNLRNIEPYIGDYEKKNCFVYKLFYGENPDFSDQNINVKFQTMYYILKNYFDIYEYSFEESVYENKSIPFSNKLARDVEFLETLEQIEEYDIDSSPIARKTIETIGNFVKEYTQNDTKNMIKLITILYAREKYERHSFFTAEDKDALLALSETSKYSIEEVDNIMNLVSEINHDIASLGKKYYANQYAIFNLFYREIPNFKDQNIKIKFQIMYYILENYFDIISDYSEEYYFNNKSIYEGKNIPFSSIISREVEVLETLEQIEEYDIDAIVQKKIVVIGDFVREHTQNDISKMSKLITILFETQKSDAFSCSRKINEETLLSLSKSTKCPIKDVEESLKLARKITNELVEEQE